MGHRIDNDESYGGRTAGVDDYAYDSTDAKNRYEKSIEMKNRSTNQINFPVEKPVRTKIWSEIKRYEKALTFAIIILTVILAAISAVSWVVSLWMSGHEPMVFFYLVLGIAFVIYVFLGVME